MKPCYMVISYYTILALIILIIMTVPGVGDKCDGGLYDDQKDDEDSSRSHSRSRSNDDDDDGEDDEEEDSSTKKRRRGRARGRVRGADSRYAVGIVQNAALQCRSGLVCTLVESGRKECQPENENGSLPTNTIPCNYVIL